MARITEAEWLELVSSPLFQRLLEVGGDVASGRADPETVEAWAGLRKSILGAATAVADALDDYPEDEHEELVREWSRAAIDNVDWSFLPKLH